MLSLIGYPLFLFLCFYLIDKYNSIHHPQKENCNALTCLRQNMVKCNFFSDQYMQTNTLSPLPSRWRARQGGKYKIKTLSPKKCNEWRWAVFDYPSHMSHSVSGRTAQRPEFHRADLSTLWKTRIKNGFKCSTASDSAVMIMQSLSPYFLWKKAKLIYSLSRSLQAPESSDWHEIRNMQNTQPSREEKKWREEDKKWLGWENKVMVNHEFTENRKLGS